MASLECERTKWSSRPNRRWSKGVKYLAKHGVLIFRGIKGKQANTVGWKWICMGVDEVSWMWKLLESGASLGDVDIFN